MGYRSIRFIFCQDSTSDSSKLHIVTLKLLQADYDIQLEKGWEFLASEYRTKNSKLVDQAAGCGPVLAETCLI